MPKHPYYDDGHRVMVGGVPQKVFIKRSRELSEQLAMIAIARDAGSELELAGAPGFRFRPVDKGAEVVKLKGAAPIYDASKHPYYAGGVRKVVAGIPVRLARIAPNHSFDHWAGSAPLYGWAERLAEFAEELEAKAAAAPLPLAA